MGEDPAYKPFFMTSCVRIRDTDIFIVINEQYCHHHQYYYLLLLFKNITKGFFWHAIRNLTLITVVYM